MANREATTDAVSVAASGDYAYIRIPQGGYLTNASSGYPEIKASIADINNATGYKLTWTQTGYSPNYGSTTTFNVENFNKFTYSGTTTDKATITGTNTSGSVVSILSISRANTISTPVEVDISNMTSISIKLTGNNTLFTFVLGN